MNKYIKIIILVIFFLIILNFSIFYYFFNNNKSTITINSRNLKNDKIDDKNEYPLTIESLRKRSYGIGTIKIEKDLGDKKGYKSYKVSYLSDGLTLYALLNIPNTKKPIKGYPVIIVNHGYIPPDQYSLENSYRLVTGYYARNGFLVLKPDYRGHDKSESDNDPKTERLSYAIDVLNLLYLIPILDSADKDNIFIYGHSMGGGVTLTVLEVANNINAATLWAAVSNEFPESILYFIRKRDPEQADSLLVELKEVFTQEDFSKLSPVNYLKYITTPIIIQHGTKDKSVPIEWSDKLVVKLKNLNIYNEYYKYENDDHNFAKGNFYKVLKKDIEFFKKYMK